MAGLPPLLRDIVSSAVADEPDMEIIGEFVDCTRVLETDVELVPDVIVLGVSVGEMADYCRRILFRFPRAKILALDGDGKSVSLYDLRPHKVPVGEVSPQELVEAIRTAVSSALA